MCQLARSALPAQRAFACRLLAVILARTQEGLRSDPTSKVADMPQVRSSPQLGHRSWAPAQECEDLKANEIGNQLCLFAIAVIHLDVSLTEG